MRGHSTKQVSFVAVGPEQRIPAQHPIRSIKALADAELAKLSPQFDAMYGKTGRPSTPPERLLKACLLIALYSVRSERQFCEQLDYNLLFRWFLDMDMSEPSFDPSTFAKNKDRILKADVARIFFEGVVSTARRNHLISPDHFSVDGTLIEAWASMKSVRPRDEDPSQRPPSDDPGNPTVDWRGEKRTNATHASTTDPEAMLARKTRGSGTKLAFRGHAVMENRNGLCVDVSVSGATGTAERDEAIRMVKRLRKRGIRVKTLAADKGYDTRAFVRSLRELRVTPHVARNHHATHPSAIDGRTTWRPGYGVSLRVRKRIEEIFGWCKTVGGLRKSRYRGVERTGLWAYFTTTAYNLVRMAKLMPGLVPA